MESVLDALKAMEKATAREIAARLDIEPRDALNMLNEQQEIGTVTFLNGYWSLSGTRPVTTKTVKRKAPKPKNQEDTVVKIGELQLMDVIRAHGPQTAEDLATLFGITSRKVIATLATATGKGRLSRIKQDGKYCYTLPESVPAYEPEPAVEPVADTNSASPAATVTDKTEPSQEAVKTDALEVSDESADVPDIASAGTESASDTPSAYSQPAAPAPDVMELPSPRAVAKNLRRHKAQLARLQKAHGAVQAVRRYGLQVTPAPKEIVREIRRLTAIVEVGTKLSGAVNNAKKYLARINRYEN
ncbi:DUF1627 domain-containing protein [Salmonella enterica subsp. diarizonae serovar 61:l,[v],[z13]:1,5,[7]]|nr:DUF1627 domain-containing protein [Salmonella enterica subsp. diarizonae serovar 61:l,[v],[z13]:1,5,[7]]